MTNPSSGADYRIALVSMPWTAPTEPSLGLGILKASLSQHGYATRVYHAAPRLLRFLTLETYQYISSCWGINEFVFTAALETQCDDDQLECLIERALVHAEAQPNVRYPSTESLCELFLDVRDSIIPAFLKRCADDILAYDPTLVGFTCMFDQTIASVSLAKMLKERRPEIAIALGGYALEGPTAHTVARAFPWVDAVVLGDGEKAIITLADAVGMSGKDHLAQTLAENLTVDGMLRPERSHGRVVALPDIERRQISVSTVSKVPRVFRAANVPMDKSPAPIYSDWFEDLKALEKESQVTIKTKILPIESSRGCWWGQVKHCVFCGIDDDALAYRQKTATKTLAMLHQMRATYGDYQFRFSDYIMPKTYYEELLPALSEVSPRFTLEAEIKANHPPARVRLMAEAGFIAVQPGIESFSTSTLRSMDKGVRAIDNVSLLKSGYVNRIVINYNLLYGLPDDEEDEYRVMLRNIPRLYHLTPPVARTSTVITRFAPLHVDRDRFGFRDRAVHHRCYDALFSTEFLASSGLSLDDYAYYFDRGFEFTDELRLLYNQVVTQVDHWKAIHRDRWVELTYSHRAGGLDICDKRYPIAANYTLRGLLADVYQACDFAPTNVAQIVRLTSASPSDVQTCVNELDQMRLIWRERDLVLGLAVPAEIAERHRQTGWPRTWLALYL